MIRFFAGHPTAANLLMGLLLISGVMALPMLKRETFPDFASDAVRVNVVYPGASAETVEEALCQRIEDAVEGLTDLEEVRCDARESLASATIEMHEDGNLNRFLADVKTEIDAIADFPDLTEDPTISELNRTDIVVSVAMTGPMAEPDLKVYAEAVKDRLIRLPGISQVVLLGFSTRQIRIEPDLVKLRQYGLSVAAIAETVGRQSLDLPSGSVETGERDVLIRFADERRSPRAFEDLVILGGATGAELRLGQIARITDRFELDEERTLFNGRRAALLQVEKTKAQDTLTVMDSVEAFVAEEQGRAPPGVAFALTRDIASIVRDRLNMLVRNGLQGLFLVFLALWLFFSFRFSFWVAMGLPASFLGTLFVMTLIGYSINMLTMVALLIAIGLMMDDAIVIAENIARHLRLGKTPLEAAVAGTREVAPGVVSSFATSVCVFVPLAFLAGDMGKVLKVVPVILIITLSVSLIEAFLILPNHMAHALTRRRERPFRGRFEAAFERLREDRLGRLVDLAVAWRYLTLGLVVMVFLVSLSMVAGGVLKFRAFPELDGDVVEARLLLPQGTPLARTEAAVEQLTTALARVDAAFAPRQPEGRTLVRNVMVRFNTNADAFETGAHLATVTADLLSAQIRDARLDDVLNLWRQETGEVADAVSVTFKEPQIGPAGQPIEIRLQGESLDQLKATSEALIAWLDRYRGVVDLSDDLRPGKPELRLKLRDGATALGLDAATVAGQLRAAYFGRTAAELQVGPESFDIDVRLPAGDQDSLADLDYFAVTLPDGAQVPLATVAEIETGRGFARVARIDGRRTVTIRGDLDTRVANLNEVLADTRARFLPELARTFPGVEVSLEGETAEQEKTGGSLRRGLMAGLIGIFLLLSFQFRSYVEPLIVMLAIPLASIGVIWGHLVMGLEVSMPSILGFASLAGIVVNDSILLVNFVKLRAAEGAEAVDAARQASRDRFRPVLLTSLTTIAGLLPLLFERSLQAQVLIPLVTSLAFGLLASTVLVLIVVPVCYAILHDLGLTTVARAEKGAAAPGLAE
ncbi:MAG: efflux RND transporter permease subunit [Rhodospirillales bacterium]|nr:efflux RND transporter permease subunit [Rhodospirillales bacterium]MDH3910232.1 efflux RND transporter permease subunit [Rhodospirillales bacterium]MDH3968111.1 efflux RND transporter permease subunit [Rhodospirillales bacterium]